MKKILFFFVSLSVGAFSVAQTNLVTNPGFEAWNAGVPDGWTMNAVTYSNIDSLKTEGASSIRCEGSISLTQKITIVPGKKYVYSFDYYIASGDGTDARSWCGFYDSSTAYTMLAAYMQTLPSLMGSSNLFVDFRGASTNVSTTSYLPSNFKQWQTYTVKFTAPLQATSGSDTHNYDTFIFSCDQKRASAGTTVVFWDNFSLVEDLSSGISTPSSSAKFTVVNNTLIAQDIADGTAVDIYTVVGAKVLSGTLVNHELRLDNLAKGIYIAKVGASSQKFVLK